MLTSGGLAPARPRNRRPAGRRSFRADPPGSAVWPRDVAGAVQLGEWARSGGHVLDVGLVIGGLALVVLLWDRVGFIPLATLFTGSLMARFRGGRLLSSFVGALVAVLIIDWIFRRLLLVPLPLGPLTGIVW